MGLIHLLHRLGRDLPLRRPIEAAVARAKRRVHNRRVGRSREQPRLDTPRILVCMQEAIGNAVEATPLVQAARMLWPRAAITALTPAGDLFDGWSIPDAVTSSPNDLEGRRFDHTFVTWSSSLPETEDDGQFGPGRFGRLHYCSCLLWRWHLKPEREYNVDMLRPLGYRGPAPPLYVTVREPLSPLPPHKFRVCLVPGGRTDPISARKHWPRYGELAQATLSEWPEAEICIIGSHSDALPGDLPDDARIHDLRGRFSLAEAAWVFRGARLVVGNDCGPMHIADAVRARCITLFGPTSELKNGPLYRGAALGLDLECRPCQFDDDPTACSDPCCMRDLAVDRVMASARNLLDQSSQG